MELTGQFFNCAPIAKNALLPKGVSHLETERKGEKEIKNKKRSNKINYVPRFTTQAIIIVDVCGYTKKTNKLVPFHSLEGVAAS